MLLIRLSITFTDHAMAHTWIHQSANFCTLTSKAYCVPGSVQAWPARQVSVQHTSGHVPEGCHSCTVVLAGTLPSDTDTGGGALGKGGHGRGSRCSRQSDSRHSLAPVTVPPFIAGTHSEAVGTPAAQPTHLPANQHHTWIPWAGWTHMAPVIQLGIDCWMLICRLVATGHTTFSRAQTKPTSSAWLLLMPPEVSAAQVTCCGGQWLASKAVR